MVSLWNKFYFSGSISEYSIFHSDVENFKELKIFFKGIIVVDKCRLEVDPVVAILLTNFRV